MQNEGISQEFSSRKVTSRREENIAKKVSHTQANPSEYLEGAS